MRTDLARQFNQEVENYRKALLFYARSRDWKTFEAKAGRLFDYLESIEFREIERRFFTIFYVILGVLVLPVIGLLSVNFGANQELMQLKNLFILSALVMSTFELYFFVDYRIYARAKNERYQQRRERFIRGIEQDFRSYAEKNEEREAA